MIARLVLLIALMWPAATVAGDRVALVIGNGAYEHTTPLANAANDANAISSALEDIGFEVIQGVDLDERGMEDTLRTFVRAIEDAKVVLFYYSGHGLQVDGKNYLVPVDADLTDRASLDFQTVDADKVFGYMGADERVALAFLDACRDNPLARTYAREFGANRGSAAGGLATPTTAGTGLFIGFATAPNDVAADGSGPNSPFTTAMLKYLATPGLEINQLMTRVKADVRTATGGVQRPWSNSDLDVDVYLVPASAPAVDAKEDSFVPANQEPGAEEALKRILAGGAYVQLGTQPTAADAQASAESTGKRLRKLLGGHALEVRAVDLGKKGVWYRVVLPTKDFGAAIEKCTELKQNGIDCIAING